MVAQTSQSAIGHTTEGRFVKLYSDKELSHAMFVDLKQTDRPILQDAILKFLGHPTDPDFPEAIREILTSEFRFLGSERIDDAVSVYLNILTEELSLEDPGFREKMVGLINIRRGGFWLKQPIVENIGKIVAKNSSEPKPIQQTGQWILVLSATIDEVNKPLAEAILAHLRQLSGDSMLTLQKIEPGSVRLFLVGSRSGFVVIQRLLEEKRISSIIGIQVKDFLWTPTPGDDESRNIIPTLVVGLGGTGVNVVERLKHNIITSTISDPNRVNFLAIDMVSQHQGSVMDLTDSEFIGIGDRGSGLDPTITRSSLFTHYDRIFSSLKEKVQSTKSASVFLGSDGDATIPTGSVNAYIVGSLAGGTGTGLSIDIGLILRQLLGDTATISGWYLLPSAFYSVVRSEPINFIGSKAIQILGYSLKNNVSVQYPDGSTYSSVAPIDNIFLVESVNKLGQPIGRAFDFYSWLSEIIFAESTGYPLNLLGEHSKQSGMPRTKQLYWANATQFNNVPYIELHSIEGSSNSFTSRTLNEQNQQ